MLAIRHEPKGSMLIKNISSYRVCLQRELSVADNNFSVKRVRSSSPEWPGLLNLVWVFPLALASGK